MGKVVHMTKVVFAMAMSLDGFVNDEHGSVELLYPDFAALDNSDLMKELIDNTGAVLMGKRIFEMPDDPDWYVGNYEFQRPILEARITGGSTCKERQNLALLPIPIPAAVEHQRAQRG